MQYEPELARFPPEMLSRKTPISFCWLQLHLVTKLFYVASVVTSALLHKKKTSRMSVLPNQHSEMEYILTICLKPYTSQLLTTNLQRWSFFHVEDHHFHVEAETTSNLSRVYQRTKTDFEPRSKSQYTLLNVTWSDSACREAQQI